MVARGSVASDIADRLLLPGRRLIVPDAAHLRRMTPISAGIAKTGSRDSAACIRGGHGEGWPACACSC